MLSNRFKNNVKLLFKGNNLKRETIINNKKKYIMTSLKNRNYNMISKKHYSSFNEPKPPHNNSPSLIIILIGIYILHEI